MGFIQIQKLKISETYEKHSPFYIYLQHIVIFNLIQT